MKKKVKVKKAKDSTVPDGDPANYFTPLPAAPAPPVYAPDGPVNDILALPAARVAPAKKKGKKKVKVKVKVKKDGGPDNSFDNLMSANNSVTAPEF